MQTINLDHLTQGGRVRNLTGHERGLAAREAYGLAALDVADTPVVVEVPEHVDAITVSFFQGMFADSVKVAGPKFLDHYRFKASPVVMEQVLRGLQRINTRRDSALG